MYQTLRVNVDMLKLIQVRGLSREKSLSFCAPFISARSCSVA